MTKYTVVSTLIALARRGLAETTKEKTTFTYKTVCLSFFHKGISASVKVRGIQVWKDGHWISKDTEPKVQKALQVAKNLIKDAVQQEVKKDKKEVARRQDIYSKVTGRRI